MNDERGPKMTGRSTNLMGPDRVKPPIYIETECSRGIAENCRGTFFVPTDTVEATCALCVQAIVGTKAKQVERRVRKTPGDQGAKNSRKSKR